MGIVISLMFVIAMTQIELLMYYIDYDLSTGAVVVICLIFAIINIVIAILGGFTLKRPTLLPDGTYSKSMGLNITLDVFMGIMLVILMIGATGIMILFLLCYVAALTLNIIGLCLKDCSLKQEEKVAVTDCKDVGKSAVQNQSIDSKIEELKHLKELGVIKCDKVRKPGVTLTDFEKEELLNLYKRLN